MKEFSNRWKRSGRSGKQRKYRLNAPLNVRRKFMRAHLSKELKEKHGKRSFGLKAGDKVKIIRGQFKGKEGRIEKVLLKKSKIQVSGAELVKREGSKSFYPIDPSNVIITHLNLDDKKRESALKRKGSAKEKAAEKQDQEVKK